MSDKEYIAAIERNDGAAIGAMYEEYRTYFFRTARSQEWGQWLPFAERRDYIADLYQDCIVELVEKVQRGGMADAEHNLKSYLVGMGKFKTSNAIRREFVKGKYESDYKHVTPITAEVEDNDRADAINKVVKMMEEPCYTLLQLFYYEELSGVEIAEKMGYSSADSVKTQKSKCMTRMKSLAQQEFKRMGL